MMAKPSRTVTRRRCIVCDQKFQAKRVDAIYCSSTCRQRVRRARKESGDLDRQIEETRRHYWSLVRLKAEASNRAVSQVLTDKAQFVDENGNVYMGGKGLPGMGKGRRLVGKTTPHREGWASWGLEAAGPPFSPPPIGSDANKRLKRKWRNEEQE